MARLFTPSPFQIGNVQSPVLEANAGVCLHTGTVWGV